jgi:hypothetical protein
MPECVDAFADLDEAAAALANYGKAFAFPRVDTDAQEIARSSAEAAWMKSLARKAPGTVDLYKRWASENVPKMAKSARYVINQEQYDILVRRTGLDLLRSWRVAFSERRSKLPFGAAFRAVDLLFKSINESKGCRSALAQDFLHVPLDGAAIRPLRICIDELIDRDFGMEIPASVPSGYIATEEHYVLFQEAILTLANRARVPPIVYSYFCDGVSPS